MDKTGLIILLGILFMIMCFLDWIEHKEELKEMRRYDEEEEQRENDDTGTAAESKR